jgi:hypothetical protein
MNWFVISTLTGIATHCYILLQEHCGAFVGSTLSKREMAAYYVICVKSGMWLPGRDIIPQQIRADRSPYYAALRSADDAYKNGKVDVSELETYLGNLLLKQLS